MVNWTEEQLMEVQARQQKKPHDTNFPDLAPEYKLQSNIEKYLTDHGFYFFHDRSRGVNRAGQPDLVIALPGARTLWLELKSATGRLSPDQKLTRQMLLALGHEFYKVRSYRSFLEIVKK